MAAYPLLYLLSSIYLTPGTTSEVRTFHIYIMTYYFQIKHRNKTTDRITISFREARWGSKTILKIYLFIVNISILFMLLIVYSGPSNLLTCERDIALKTLKTVAFILTKYSTTPFTHPYVK